jgi:regulator of protease activity HflC (stomatin/prohibitin superfamily)
MNDKVFGWLCGTALAWLCFGGAVGGLYAVPKWRVWQQGLQGEASLRRAEQEKQIQVEQARAELESAKLRADAIQTIGQAAKDFPEYRLQEFLGAFGEAMQDGSVQKIIYVPTEANIPIMEAGRTAQ